MYISFNYSGGHYLSSIIVNHMDKIQPLNTSAKLSLSRVQTNLAQSSTQSSQDSLINDSGFLPSTPPSKKVMQYIMCS